jgi:hypothetical protein
MPAFVGAIEKTEIVADVVGKQGLQATVDDAERRGAAVAPVVTDDHGGAHVAEDKVRIPVAEIEMARADFRVDDEDVARAARHDRIAGLLQPEGRGGAGNIHVKGVATGADRVLYFHGHRGVGALHIRGGAQYRIDIAGIECGASQCLACRLDGHLAHHRRLVVRSFRDVRNHARRIENS